MANCRQRVEGVAVRGLWRAARLLATMLLVAKAGPAAAGEVEVEVEVSPGLHASPALPRGIRVQVEAGPADSWAGLARRLTGRFANARALQGDGPAKPVAGRRYDVAFDLLSDARKREVVLALLPGDRCEEGVWVHERRPGLPGGGDHALAEWFSSGSAGAPALESALAAPGASGSRRVRLPCVGIAPWLARARGCCAGLPPEVEEDRAEAAAVESSPLDLLLAGPARERSSPAPAASRQSPAIREGQADRAPPDLLLGDASRRGAGTTDPGPRLAPAEAASPLTFGKDALGEYASYRLRPGESIYSAVIARFTGRVHAREVNELVPVIAERSGVAAFEKLPVGFEVKLPVHVLAPEYRPKGDPGRERYERRREVASRHTNPARASDLAGVTVLLDAGHGGKDLGAVAAPIWESDYVYDVMCRIKRRLEESTWARVRPLIGNDDIGFAPRDGFQAPAAGAKVLTRPPFALEDPVAGVNLRWYLANSLYRKALAEGADPGRVVFLSVHADSLHPSVGGAMVYVPSEEHTGGRHGRRGDPYDSRQEVREERYFSFSARERQQAEGWSRQLAARLLRAFAAHGLPVHVDQPVRGSVLRNGREWLPAVLRSNRVPTRVLLEVGNLNHADDNKLIAAAAFREAAARAVVEALLQHYAGETSSKATARR